MSVVPSVIDIMQLINVYMCVVCVSVQVCMYVCVEGREGSDPGYTEK